jgi:hypothetical protein
LIANQLTSLSETSDTPITKTMNSLRSAAWLSVVGTLLFTTTEALAQVEIERPTAGRLNAVGISAFVGPNLTPDTYFYGASAEYDRLLTSKWEFAVSVGADWVPSQAEKIEHSFSLTLDGGYSLTDRFSAELAYVKQFARYGLETNYGWKWVNGDNAVGMGASYTLWERGRHSVDITVGLERNLTASETSINFNLGYGLSF